MQKDFSAAVCRAPEDDLFFWMEISISVWYNDLILGKGQGQVNPEARKSYGLQPERRAPAVGVGPFVLSERDVT